MSDYSPSDDDFDLDMAGLLDTDYTYVDDGYHVADDLAERAVASPPPYDDDDDDWYDWDRFDYWHEYEDGSCGYFDYQPRKRVKKQAAALTGDKRKAGRQAHGSTKKLRRADGQPVKMAAPRALSPTPTVLWMSQSARPMEPKAKLVNPEKLKPVTIFQDFQRRRGKGDAAVEHQKAQVDDNAEQLDRPVGREEASHSTNGPVDTPGELEADLEEDVDHPMVANALRSILEQRLASAGTQLKGFEHDMLLQYAMRMLSGGDSDDIAGELAETILGGAPEDQDDAWDMSSETTAPAAAGGGLSAWLAQQVESSKQPNASSSPNQIQSQGQDQTPIKLRGRNTLTPSPTDSSTSSVAVAKSAATHPAASANPQQPSLTPPHEEDEPEEEQLHEPSTAAAQNPPRQHKQPLARKRKAEPDDDDSDDDGNGEGEGALRAGAGPAKRRAPSYAAPTTASKARSASMAGGSSRRTGRNARA